ncbi:MAG: NUDIX domain-containing protein [Gammaproteobacteria bacterium]|nr:NUDIX domain-containing protein [Gammaproteobacteria bacterium]MDE1887766.1 NUDIX domain-containing protein [Gammaproteobacteria bacterium]MDE2024771.1 NUDIX domain-containing protein [Gammaproteobacteria bacterium]MDE2140558.1 NUDIX domain-containing protein [Gammaproteobacteria bacterium]MDE2273337.1 NUDIX domain-containing protein [Gammaproteobacteria bacterium]
MSQARTHLSVGVAVLRETPAGRRYLLLRAWRYWDFPKGAVEPGETPLQAAIREVHEETGLDDLEFLHGEAYAETAPYNRGKVARYYLARTRTDAVVLSANPVTGIREHMEYRWLGHPQAAQLVTPRVKLILDWAESLAAGATPVTANSTSARSKQPQRE